MPLNSPPETPSLRMGRKSVATTFYHGKYLYILSYFLPVLEGRGFPSRGFIVPTIGSGLHPSFGGQSSGSENHSHLALRVWGYPPQRGLSSLSSSPLKGRRDDWYSSRSPIKPSIELGRSVISITKRCLEKEVFKTFYKGAIHPRPKGRGFTPP